MGRQREKREKRENHALSNLPMHQQVSWTHSSQSRLNYKLFTQMNTGSGTLFQLVVATKPAKMAANGEPLHSILPPDDPDRISRGEIQLFKQRCKHHWHIMVMRVHKKQVE